MKTFAALNVLKQFLVIYVRVRDRLQTCGLYSTEAETVLLSILQCADTCLYLIKSWDGSFRRDAFMKSTRINFSWCSELIRTKMMAKRFLQNYWRKMTAGQKLFWHCFVREWTWENTMILNSLYIFVRGCPMSVQRMHKNGVLCTLQSFMLLWSCKVPSVTRVSCLELLFHTLFFLNKEIGSREATS